MNCKMLCSSHSPLMQMYAREPDDHQAIRALFEQVKSEIDVFDPELVVVLGCDHFNGFFLDCMPSFCLGTKCEAVDDVGGTPGVLQVTPQATTIAGALRQQGVDTAVSFNMKVDHGFSQTMAFVLGELDRYLTLPIFINSIAPPYIPFHRSRVLGEQLADILQQQGIERLLVIATGGMSHNPTRYYPDPALAEAPVQHYQMNGPSPDGMTHEQWLQRLDEMHHEGAKMLVDGRRTRQDIKMNPELDKRFADLLCSGQIKALDDWDNVALIEQGGIGFTELHTWVAATSLFQQLNPNTAPKFEIYSETLEYGIGFGAMTGGF